MYSPIRFNGFSFHYEIGELIHRDESGREIKTRLAPQPCKLLLLLLKKYPDILSQKDIKDVLWPDVHVDYERSLHYCIRQIRSSLNDNASQPIFIETIPRRGYRWIAPIEEEAPRRSSPSWFRISTKPTIAFGLIATISLLLYALISWRTSPLTHLPNKNMPIRIAIMPFQPKETSNQFAGNDIAYQLVESLTNDHGDTYQIIGPTSTANYLPGQLRGLIQDFEIDCVINGKFSNTGKTSRLLAEVIRAEDGAHIWVQYFDSSTPIDSIVQRIEAGFVEQFGANEHSIN